MPEHYESDACRQGNQELENHGENEVSVCLILEYIHYAIAVEGCGKLLALLQIPHTSAPLTNLPTIIKGVYKSQHPIRDEKQYGHNPGPHQPNLVAS